MVPKVDASEWPIVRITYGETIALDEISEFGAALLTIFHKRGPMVTVADISDLNALATTALHRQRIAQEADKLAAQGAFVAEAVVIRNPVTRFLYAGYLWSKQTKSYPTASFTRADEALAWAHEQLSAAGPKSK